MQQISLSNRNDNNNTVFTDQYRGYTSVEENFNVSSHDHKTPVPAFSEITPSYNWEFFCNELEYE